MISLTTKLIACAVASLCWLTWTANAGPSGATGFLEPSFLDKIGPFSRVSVSKNEAAIQGEVLDAVSAKYVSGGSEIEWSGTQYAAPEQAFAAVERMTAAAEKNGAGVSSVKNVEGKVRYAVMEFPEGVICCWVSKHRKDLFFVAHGKLAEIDAFMRAQATW